MGEYLSRIDVGTDIQVEHLFVYSYHACIVSKGNVRVKCFGRNNFGQLGLGDTEWRGDQVEEMGDFLPFVSLGSGMSGIVANKGIATGGGLSHSTCIVVANDEKLKCFGSNHVGQLGLGDTNNRGNAIGQMGDNLQHVQLANCTA